ncbi:hypothetical protein [Paenibacillus wenxiniae]|uniref:SMI1/KNR4 family protein n=1 Tax=Paenibacillus wenxiniae TaxID=1636843 RepID=A0ABW4RES8_9BACL
MTHEQIVSFIRWNQERGCEAKLTAGANDEQMKELSLPSILTQRYGTLPTSFSVWIQSVQTLVAPHGQAWFLTAADYREHRNDDIAHQGAAFAWNEWESMSLEAAGDDADWQQQIRSFWDRYVPIVMIVQPEYAFYAIDTHSRDGAVIYGREPEFEESDEIAASFEQFMQRIMDGTLKWYSQV